MMIFGPILLLIVIFYPQGIAGALQNLSAKFRRRRAKQKAPGETTKMEEVG